MSISADLRALIATVCVDDGPPRVVLRPARNVDDVEVPLAADLKGELYARSKRHHNAAWRRKRRAGAL